MQPFVCRKDAAIHCIESSGIGGNNRRRGEQRIPRSVILFSGASCAILWSVPAKLASPKETAWKESDLQYETPPFKILRITSLHRRVGTESTSLNARLQVNCELQPSNKKSYYIK